LKKINFVLSGLRKGSVLAIGVFDGVHRGHQELLKRAKDLALNEGTILAVLTFSPHPEEILKGEKNLLILAEEERKNKILDFGADVVITQKIDSSFLSLEPEEFAAELATFAPGWVVVGGDFHFGRERKGDLKFLRKMGEKFGFKVESVPLYEYKGEKVSSSLIREALTKGDFEKVRRLLGFSYYLKAKVRRRKGLASQVLGYPTANLFLDERLFVLPSGVYFGRAELQNRLWKALIYVGTSPTLGLKEKSLEAHLIDFQGEIAPGEVVKLEFLKKLREERVFPSTKELKAQVKRDIEEAKRLIP
jgi:riboflavin kinase/FMN adenylyltransferase